MKKHPKMTEVFHITENSPFGSFKPPVPVQGQPTRTGEFGTNKNVRPGQCMHMDMHGQCQNPAETNSKTKTKSKFCTYHQSSHGIDEF